MRIIRADQRSFVPASHEDPQRPGVLKRVLATRDELLDGRVQMINWSRLAAGSSFRAHYHEDMEELFLLLEGRAEVVVGSVREELTRGDLLIVSPREVHTMRNLTDADLDYLVVGISRGEGGRTVVTEVAPEKD